jgi:hypothetical protein
LVNLLVGGIEFFAKCSVVSHEVRQEVDIIPSAAHARSFTGE